MSHAKRRDPMLSKSRYLAGLQCHLRLWYQCKEPGLAPPVDAATQAIFDTGHEVGVLATGRHPGGVLVEEDHRHHQEALATTARLIPDRKVPAIFEAAFVHDDVRVRADILVRGPKNAWDLVEVKSALDVKPVNVDDVAVQYRVLKRAGLKVRRAGVLTLNRSYVYAGGKHDLGTLFRLHDLTAEVAGKDREVERNVAEMHEMLRRRNPPDIEPGPQCNHPYDCPYIAYCTRDMVLPEHPIDELPNLRGKRLEMLVAQGLTKIDQIPAGADLTSMQERVCRAVQTGKPWRSRGLKSALAEPIRPVHHLDFETFMTAVPRYKGTSPYEPLPFQWSNHVEQKNGKLRHDEYLCREDVDPRPEFAETMLESLGTDGTICIYTSYELTIIRQLADHLPQYRKRLLALTDRAWDLHAVIRQNYYHPDFHGSFSLKKVLPALVPKMTYEGMDIPDGGAASRAHVEAITTDDPARKEELQKALLEYCGQDTKALVEMRRVLGR